MAVCLRRGKKQHIRGVLHSPIIHYGKNHYTLYFLIPKRRVVHYCSSPLAPAKPVKAFQFSSVTQSCPTLCNSMDCSMPGFPVHHQLLELAQTHVYPFSNAIQPSHLLLSPSPPAISLSQRQGLFQWVSSSHRVAKVLELQLQHQSFQWIVRTDFL